MAEHFGRKKDDWPYFRIILLAWNFLRCGRLLQNLHPVSKIAGEGCKKSTPDPASNHGQTVQENCDEHCWATTMQQFRQALYFGHLRLCNSLPQAVAMRTIDANAVAEEQLVFLYRVGVSEEILKDKGTNFTSQILAEVYRLLQSGWHPTTNRLTA